MSYTKVKTWDEAFQNLQEVSNKAQRENDKVQAALAEMLRAADTKTATVQGKAFYTSKMRAKTVLRGATKVELERVQKVINEMLEAF